MKLDQPSDEVKNAIKHAVEWFEAHQLKGFRFGRLENGENSLIADAGAVCWARFYDLQTNRPVFGDRDNSIKYNLSEISAERRNGYAWYGDFAYKLLTSEYPKWMKRNPQ
ncbi:pectate lyase [compost metagenome]